MTETSSKLDTFARRVSAGGWWTLAWVTGLAAAGYLGTLVVSPLPGALVTLAGALGLSGAPLGIVLYVVLRVIPATLAIVAWLLISRRFGGGAEPFVLGLPMYGLYVFGDGLNSEVSNLLPAAALGGQRVASGWFLNALLVVVATYAAYRLVRWLYLDERSARATASGKSGMP